MSKQAAVKTPGKCASLHAMWNEAGDGQPLPRNFAVEMAIAAGAKERSFRRSLRPGIFATAQEKST